MIKIKVKINYQEINYAKTNWIGSTGSFRD